jgi:hypothetical protein
MLLSKALQMQQDLEDKKNEIIIEGLENKIKEYEASLEKKDFLPQAMEGLKGKCAFGPFLSILVIECKHKCLNVKICPWMNKVQITS